MSLSEGGTPFLSSVSLNEEGVAFVSVGFNEGGMASVPVITNKKAPQCVLL